MRAVNFAAGLGYDDRVDLKPRPPRLRIEEIVHRPATGGRTADAVTARQEGGDHG